MTEDYHKGAHLGYLEYHTNVLEDAHEQLVDDLADIRAEYNGADRYKKEQQRLLEFHNNALDRVGKIAKQIEGVKDHEDEQVLERADNVQESAYNTHQEDGIDDIPTNTGFKTASEWSE